jgi:PelA/Pel-15E family pectate lyase
VSKSDHAPVPITHWLKQPDAWFTTPEGEQVLTVVLSWQSRHGGWHKNYDSLTPAPQALREVEDGKIPAGDTRRVWEDVATIDNDATYSELRLLARAIRVTGRADLRSAFDRGVEYLLRMQYPSGGFPQRFPLQNNYGRHITYNDGAMVGVLTFLRDASEAGRDFAFIPPETRTRMQQALSRGIDCILSTQIVTDGQPTVWCQQHDEVTLAPAGARAYELPSYCSSESAGVTLFLMDIPNPDARVIRAIDGAVAWFEKTKIIGKKYERVPTPNTPKGTDRHLVDDPTGNTGPLWARFYDLKTTQPMFVDRDGVPKASVLDIGYERRNGYAWYSTMPQKVLKAYGEWKKRVEKSR